MKKQIAILILLNFLIVIIVNSCGKKYLPSSTEEQTTEILTSQNWKQQSASYTSEDKMLQPNLKLVSRNLFISFLDDGTYAITSSSMGVISFGTWVMNESGDVIIVTDQYTMFLQ